MRIDALDVEPQILEKIERKHGVTLDEIDEVCESRRISIRRGREGLHRIFGRTVEGRARTSASPS